MNYTGEKAQDPITFNIYPDEKGSASVTLYEDDGASPAYKQGGFRRTTVDVKRVAAAYSVNIAAPEGSYNPGSRKFSFLIKAGGQTRNAVTVPDSGAAHSVAIR
jgi:alpha-glucosidase (family GH31 glycosyl hydrolase)